MMRRLIIGIILILSTLFIKGQGSYSFMLDPNFYNAYLYVGDQYYEQEKYDSALMVYSIPHALISTCHQKNLNSMVNCWDRFLFHHRFFGKVNLKLGKAFYFLNEYENAKTCLTVLRNYCDELHIETTLKSDCNYFLGLVHNKMEDFDKSLLYYYECLNQVKILDNDSAFLVGLIYCDIGNIYYSISNYKKALEFYYISKEILCTQAEPDNSKISIITNNIGSLYYRLGEYNLAIDNYKEAINLMQKGDINYYDLSMYYNNLGGLYLMVEEFESSDTNYQISLSIRKEILNDNNLIVQSYNQLGLLYFLMKDYPRALNQIQNSILFNTINFSDTAITAIPNINDIIDFKQFGLALYYKTIILFSMDNCKSSNEERNCISMLKSFDFLLNLYNYIYKNQDIGNNNDFFLSLNRDVINAAIDIYYTLGFISDEEIFNLIERGKSVILNQSVIETNAKNFAGVPSNLLELEKRLRRRVSALNLKIEMAQDNNLDLNNSAGFYDIILERNLVVAKTDSLIRHFESSYPQYYKLKYNLRGISLAEVQQTLDDSSAILDYYLSDSLIYIVFISNKNFKIVHKKKDSIEYMVREHNKAIRFYDEVRLIYTGTWLYHNLIEPVEFYLTPINNIIVIPDVELAYFPFETILIPGPNSIEQRYLVTKYSVVYHFSTHLWSLSVGNRRGHSGLIETKNLLAYAPVFNNPKHVMKTNGEQVSPLPYSQKEVMLIEELFVKNGIDVLSIYYEDATKESFYSKSSNYNIIHLATHGLYDENNPSLSGIVLFSKTTNDPNHFLPDSIPELDILYVDETYNLSLNADLFVLSACSTGPGKIQKGEGLMTLYRGLFYAGAKNILYSLWNISDKYAAHFMSSFYNYIIEGKTYSLALRKTKIDLINTKATTLPAFWSGYQLLGN